MPPKVKLFVVDTGPLITLALVGSLDYLLQVNVDVVIPDAVLYEAAHDASKLGAQDIIDWMIANRNRVELAPTKAYLVFVAARATLPDLREASLGERAAVEVIEAPDRLNEDERAVLLCEETTVLRRVVVRDKTRILELSTLDFLRILEGEQKIQSADHVFEVAAQRGRDPSRVEKLSSHSKDIQEAIRALLRDRTP